jgi:hypothetical protein
MDFEYDCECECECEKLTQLPKLRKAKVRGLAKLRARHRERRQPYIQQLAILQDAGLVPLE